jgi:hypothetical protein
MAAGEEELGLEALAHQPALHVDQRHQHRVDDAVGDGLRQLVERDGLVTLAGAGLGLVAIAVTVVVGVMIVLGAEALAN